MPKYSQDAHKDTHISKNELSLCPKVLPINPEVLLIYPEVLLI